MSKESLANLTAEQESLIPKYVDQYFKIGISTERADRPKAEDAVRRAYAYMKKVDPTFVCQDNLTFHWEESPFAGAVKAAKLYNNKQDVTAEEIASMAENANFGSFEAYWVSFYAFVAENFPVEKDELIHIVKDIVKECGVFWAFESCVVLTEKPTEFHLKDNRLHREDGMALVYADGTGVYTRDGEMYEDLLSLEIRTARGDDKDDE